MQEKRRYVRWRVKSPLRYKIQGSDLECEGLTKDISNGGAGIFISEELVLNSLLDLTLEIPDKFRPISTQGKIIWQKKLEIEDTFPFATGIQFSQLKDEDKEKIFLYVRENLSEELRQRWWQGLK